MAAEPKPRNRRAAARGARTRELIRQMLLEHAARCPLARPLTGKLVQEQLRQRGIHLRKSSVARYLSGIRLEAELAALSGADVCWKSSNSTNTTPGV